MQGYARKTPGDFFSMSKDVNPIGAIIEWGGIAPKTGWVQCDGRAISRTTYAELFSVIGTTFGAGDGIGTFNVPNYTPEAITNIYHIIKGLEETEEVFLNGDLINTNGRVTDYPFTTTSSLSYSLPYTPISKNSLLVIVNGIIVHPNDYSINVNLLIFGAGTIVTGDSVLVKIIDPVINVSTYDFIDVIYDDKQYVRKNLGWVNFFDELVDTSPALGTSDILLPTQNAVRQYVGSGIVSAENYSDASIEVLTGNGGVIPTKTIEQLVNYDTAIESAISLDKYNQFYENYFPSIEVINGLDQITTSSPLYTRIAVYGGTVNTNAYTHWTTLYHSRYMTYIIDIQKTNGAQTGGRFVIEVPVTDGVHLSFFLLSMHGSGFNSYNIWYADPVTDAPAKRAGWVNSHYDSSAFAGIPLWLGPDTRRDVENQYHDWLMVHLNKDDVALYKSGSNTIKLSICANANHVYTYSHVSGWAICENKLGLAWKPSLFTTSWCPDGGGQSGAEYGNYEGSYMSQLGTNATASAVRIPIIDDDKAILIGMHYHAPNSYNGHTIWTITGTTTKYFPRMLNIGKYARVIEIGMRGNQSIKGFIIPQSVVQANMKVTAEGWRYLEFDVLNASPAVEYQFGWYSEQIEAVI